MAFVSPLVEVAVRLGATNLNFIVDTGAAETVIAKQCINSVVICPTDISIVSANVQKI